MLDHARTLRIPREGLPGALEEFAAEHGLGWWLDREYGPRVADDIDVISRAASTPWP